MSERIRTVNLSISNNGPAHQTEFCNSILQYMYIVDNTRHSITAAKRVRISSCTYLYVLKRDTHRKIETDVGQRSNFSQQAASPTTWEQRIISDNFSLFLFFKNDFLLFDLRKKLKYVIDHHLVMMLDQISKKKNW